MYIDEGTRPSLVEERMRVELIDREIGLGARSKGGGVDDVELRKMGDMGKMGKMGEKHGRCVVCRCDRGTCFTGNPNFGINGF